MNKAERTLKSLQSLDFFKNAGANSLMRIARMLRPRTWPAGAAIFQRGDSGDGLIVLLEGAVRLSIDTPDGKQLTVRIAGPGEVVGEIALLDGGGRTADARAIEDTKGYLLPHAAFTEALAASSGLQLSVTQALCRRLRDTTEQLEMIALWPLESRLAKLLTVFARSRGVPEGKSGRRFELKISQTELAALIGASRPKVSAAFAELKRLGAVTLKGAACVCDMNALNKIAGEAVLAE